MRVLPAIVASIALLACSERQEAAAAEPPAPMPEAPPPAALPEPAAPTPVPQPTVPVPVPAPVAFACGDDARSAPDELRRLTMTQYRNTVRDLARWALGDATAADAALALAALDTVPLDRRAAPGDPHGGYRRLDQALDQVHVDETYRAAAALGRALAAPERIGTVAGACAGDQDAGNDEACVSDFIRRFGARALRRPLDDDDVGFYRIVYGADPTPSPTAYADLITALLSAPELLYFVEHGADELEGDPGNYALSAHELAARLSYHFWQTLPDDGLWQAAADGTLLEPDVLAQQIDRLLADGRARATMAELFGDWLGLEALPELDAHAQDRGYATFASSDLPGPELRRHVIDEALDMLAHYTWTEPAGVAALFTSERSFARSADLAHIYGVEPWDGSSAPPAMPHGSAPGCSPTPGSWPTPRPARVQSSAACGSGARCCATSSRRHRPAWLPCPPSGVRTRPRGRRSRRSPSSRGSFAPRATRSRSTRSGSRSRASTRSGARAASRPRSDRTGLASAFCRSTP